MIIAFMMSSVCGSYFVLSIDTAHDLASLVIELICSVSSFVVSYCNGDLDKILLVFLCPGSY